MGEETCSKVFVPYRSSTVRHASSTAGSGRRLDPSPGDAALGDEVIARRQARSGTLAGDDFDDLSAGVIHHNGHFAAKAEHTAIGHRQREDDGYGGVSRVAARSEDRHARIDRLRPPRSNRPMPTGRMPRVGGRARLRRFLRV